MSWLNDRVEKIILSSSYDKVKTHILANKKVYIAAGAGFIVGASLVLIVKNKTTVNVVNNFSFSHN